MSAEAAIMTTQKNTTIWNISNFLTNSFHALKTVSSGTNFMLAVNKPGVE